MKKAKLFDNKTFKKVGDSRKHLLAGCSTAVRSYKDDRNKALLLLDVAVDVRMSYRYVRPSHSGVNARFSFFFLSTER
jgi:hypothetical protein